nr:hypothetical protein [Alphaproteobacteria bacterium]
NRIEFKQVKEIEDNRKIEVFRPVCPWFELHGEWEINGETFEGPITKEVLRACGVETMDKVRWSVEVANRKAYNMTLSRGDIVTARVPDDPDERATLAGDITSPQQLNGKSKDFGPGELPLVLSGKSIPMGQIQLSKPSSQFPGFQGLRLRFTPPTGAVYGPGDLSSRTDDWKGLDIIQDPDRFLILNDQARWSQWVKGDDNRTVPRDQFAHVVVGSANRLRSLGLIDDFSDGIITCQIGDHAAHARIVVGPPDYAPDRRHPVTLADNLKDRVDRDDVHDVYANVSDEEFSRDIEDLFQRIWETVGLVNLDGQNFAAQTREFGRPPFDTSRIDFQLDGNVLPLTKHARRMHRRLGSTEVVEDVFRERKARSEDQARRNESPRSLDQLLNQPPQPNGDLGQDRDGRRNSFGKMPALMRGSDFRPLHLTRRQQTVLKEWIRRLSLERRGGGRP